MAILLILTNREFGTAFIRTVDSAKKRDDARAMYVLYWGLVGDGRVSKEQLNKPLYSPLAMTFGKKRQSLQSNKRAWPDASDVQHRRVNTLDLWSKREEQTGGFRPFSTAGL